MQNVEGNVQPNRGGRRGGGRRGGGRRGGARRAGRRNVGQRGRAVGRNVGQLNNNRGGEEAANQELIPLQNNNLNRHPLDAAVPVNEDDESLGSDHENADFVDDRDERLNRANRNRHARERIELNIARQYSIDHYNQNQFQFEEVKEFESVIKVRFGPSKNTFKSTFLSITEKIN